MSVSNRSSRAWFLGGALTVALLTAVGAASPVVASPPGGVAALEADDVFESAPDEAAASGIAVAEGHDVIVDEFTTEFTQVVATPDGSFEMTSTSVPVRTEVDGEWVDIDTDLALAESGYLEPGATTVPVQFSAGGSDELARVQLPSGDWLTERWPLGALPEPAVEGPVALYEDVLPDVDLRLTATATGMAEVLVVNTEEAAENPDLATISIAVEGASITQLEDGTTLAAPEGDPATSLEDASLISSTPTSWDSSDRNSGPEGVGGADMETPVAAEVEDDVLTLDVAATLDDEDLVYPVYVDPDWNATIDYWTIIESFPNTTYPAGMDGTLPVGYLDPYYAQATGGTYLRARSFWSMSIVPLHGKQIIAAQFSNTEVWAFSCTETPVELWQTDAVPNASWNGSVYTSWYGLIETKTISYGYNYATCPNGRSAPAQLGWNVTSWVAGAAASTHPVIGTTFTLGMRASNESANNQWKKFAPQATLVVTYNTQPNQPTSPAMISPPRACSTVPTSPSFINGTQAFTLQATSTDPDPGNVSTRFYFEGKVGSSWYGNGQYGATPMQAQGAQSYVVPANSVPPGSYRWYARTYDGLVLSSPGQYCYFDVKNSSPGLPTLTVVNAGTGYVGDPVTVKFTAALSDKVAIFAYWWDTNAVTNPTIAPPVTSGAVLPACGSAVGAVKYVCPDGTGNSPTVTVAPTTESSYLYVASYDAAGNLSSGPTGPSAYQGFTVLPDSEGVGIDLDNGAWNGHAWLEADGSGQELVDLSQIDPEPLVGLTGQNGIGIAPFAPFGTEAMLSNPGYLSLNRYFNGSRHIDSLEGSTLAGFTLELQNGWILPVQTSTPSWANVLMRCGTIPNDRLSITGCGSDPSETLGYTWKTAADAVASVSLGAAGGLPELLKDCYQSINDHYSSRSATCEGGTTAANLGYILTAPPAHTSGPVIDTRESFSVSAWLRPGASTGLVRSVIALAQSGASNSGFYLGFTPERVWQFCMRTQTSPIITHCAYGPAVTNDWEFVVGVWDAANQEIRIYVGSGNAPADVEPHTPNPVA
jgi:hypothetical protein